MSTAARAPSAEGNTPPGEDRTVIWCGFQRDMGILFKLRPAVVAAVNDLLKGLWARRPVIEGETDVVLIVRGQLLERPRAVGPDRVDQPTSVIVAVRNRSDIQNLGSVVLVANPPSAGRGRVANSAPSPTPPRRPSIAA
jgi:hypothetical protein